MAKALQTTAPYFHSLSGVVRALNDIEKRFNAEVKQTLGPEYRGVLRGYDYESAESRPIVTGDLRDTTYFVILKGPGNNIVAAQSVLFEAELESEEYDDETIEETEKHGERAVQKRFYDKYMQLYEELYDAGYFDKMFEEARRTKVILFPRTAGQMLEAKKQHARFRRSIRVRGHWRRR